jgi:ribose/xylose/arabinose/galactoside ABC-type transport system permease subunit
MTGRGKLRSGAGFGVTVTPLTLAVVLAVVTGAEAAPTGRTPVPATAGGVLLTAAVDAGLFYLAFPTDRPTVRIDPAQVGRDDGE